VPVDAHLFVASAAFWSLFQQQFTTVAIYADKRLDRNLFGGGPNSAPLLGLAGILLLFTFAELLLSPVGLSLSTKLAPAAFHTQMVALFFLSVALGSSLAGTLSRFYDEDDEVPYFATVGLTSIVIGVLLAVLSPWIRRLMGGVH